MSEFAGLLRRAIEAKRKSIEANLAAVRANGEARQAYGALASHWFSDENGPSSPWLIDGLVVMPDLDEEAGRILDIDVLTPTVVERPDSAMEAARAMLGAARRHHEHHCTGSVDESLMTIIDDQIAEDDAAMAREQARAALDAIGTAANG